MRYAPLVLSLLLCSTPPALAQLSISFGSPGVSVGINLPVYPTLQRVPGYPVYYAPGLDSNYFFYDGLYWVYEQDSWYASSWYNGPWSTVDRFDVPVYLLRVPVRYYRQAPAYFRGWRADAPPRWGDHWGSSWQQRRSGWDRWDRRSAPAPAPLPTFQRQYYGDRYPQHSQQAVIQGRNYRYQPRDTVARQHYQQQRDWARQDGRTEPRRDQRGEPQRDQRGERREQRAAEQQQQAQERAQREERRAQRDERREQRAAQQQQAQERAQRDERREQRAGQQQQQAQQRAAQQQQQTQERAQRDAFKQQQDRERAQQRREGLADPKESGG